MKTKKLPQSAWSASQEYGSQSQQTSQFNECYLNNNDSQQRRCASNDASYEHDISHKTILAYDDSAYSYRANAGGGFVSQASQLNKADLNINKQSTINSSYKKPSKSVKNNAADDSDALKQLKQYQIWQDNNESDASLNSHSERSISSASHKAKNNSEIVDTVMGKDCQFKRNIQGIQSNGGSEKLTHKNNNIPERVFMNSLVKHTFIALAIIIPLAIFSTYAAAQAPVNNTVQLSVPIQPSAIIYKAVNVPTTVDSVDLEQYAGTWYEIGRLPMYFQRNCARDVTATYTGKTDGSGIIVTNKCIGADGAAITADGLAKAADNTGSKLKVTFLPSWIRWLPIGRADYWVLARDDDYQTALVGTPNKDYLWLLARSPNITQQTYAEYRQIAQQQGYDLKEFKLTPQSNQTVTLIP